MTQRRKVLKHVSPPLDGMDHVYVYEEYNPRTGKFMEIPDDTNTYEAVSHPTHYTTHPSGVECITIIQEFTFNVGAAIKHLWRAGGKPGASVTEDLQKALTYIQFEIARIEGRQKK